MNDNNVVFKTETRGESHCSGAEAVSAVMQLPATADLASLPQPASGLAQPVTVPSSSTIAMISVAINQRRIISLPFLEQLLHCLSGLVIRE